MIDVKELRKAAEEGWTLYPSATLELLDALEAKTAKADKYCRKYHIASDKQVELRHALEESQLGREVAREGWKDTTRDWLALQEKLSAQHAALEAADEFFWGWESEDCAKHDLLGLAKKYRDARGKT